MAPRPTTLAEVEAEVWRELKRATRDKQHEWRTCVLATLDGALADARTVILREVDVHQKQLLIFTDQRAGKVTQLLRQPRATMVMWSAAHGWQLRCRVLLSLEMTGLAATSFWARIKLTPAAQDYLAPLPPGSPLDSPLDQPPQAPALSTSAESPALARAYFAVVNAAVLSIDWLELDRAGHRRAVFGEDGSRWVQP